MGFFDAAVPRIIELALSQLARVWVAGMLGGRQCKKVLLVGGFATSKYLEFKLRAALQGKVTHVIVPSKPHAAVLSGEQELCRYGFKLRCEKQMLNQRWLLFTSVRICMCQLPFDSAKA